MSSLMEDEMHVQHFIRCLQDTGPYNVVFNDADCHGAHSPRRAVWMPVWRHSVDVIVPLVLAAQRASVTMCVV